MSKNDNLHEFLVDIADSIREKKGTTEPINAQQFSEEIRNLPSGEEKVEEKDINFYDYDGTLLFSYTIPEAQALTELPTPKGHSGLIFDGWNWDYEDVIALDYPMNIGAMYRTDDGKTRLYLKVEEPTSISLSFNNTGTATVDFGDGEVVETSETTPVLPHRYEVGEYVLRISGTEWYMLQGNSSINIFGMLNNRSSELVKKVELGEKVSVGQYAFAKCSELETISAPSVTGVYSFGSSAAFSECSSLKHVNFTKSSNGVSYLEFLRCFNLRNITIPNKSFSLTFSNLLGSTIRHLRVNKKSTNLVLSDADLLEEFVIHDGITALEQAMFANCHRLKKVVIPNTVKNVGPSVFSNCWALKSIVVPNSITGLTALMFYRNYSLKSVKMSNILSIANRVFEDCTSLLCIDMRDNTVVPTLSNVDSFTKTTSAIIVVPDTLYDEWIVATNWSSLGPEGTNQIIKASEYESLNQ